MNSDKSAEAAVSGLRVNAKLETITIEILDWCLENNKFIDLKTGLIVDSPPKTKGRNVRSLKVDLYELISSGACYPGKYASVFGVDCGSLIHNVLYFADKPTINVRNLYPNESKEKQQQTMLARHGVAHNWQKGRLRDRLEAKWLDTYGVTNPLGSDQVKAKIRSTMNTRYNSDYFAGTELHRSKTQQTMLARHGVAHNWQKGRLRDRLEAKWLDTYGVTNPLGSDQVKAKIKITNIKRYGVEHPLQNPNIHRSTINSRGWGARYDNACGYYDYENLEGDLRAEVFNFMDGNYSRCQRDHHLKALGIKSSKDYSTELKVFYFLSELRISDRTPFIRNARSAHGVICNTKPYDMDFYFPSLRLGIEVNGLATHSVNKAANDETKTKDYHFRKFLKFHKSGIKVISFTDWDLYNRWDSVKNIIKHHLLDEEIEESTKVEFPDLYQSLNYGLFDYNKFEEKLQLTQNYEDFVQAKFIDEWEYWDCGKC